MASLTHFDPETQSSTVHGIPKPTTIDLVGGISCHICCKTLPNKKDFDTHYVLHNTESKEIVYTCVVCLKQIAGYPSFRGHCYTNHVIKDRFKCQHCFKLFSKSTALNEHIKIMHKFKCPDCSKEFASKKELQLHRIIHNNTDTPPFKCQSCQAKIDNVDGCKEHVFMHSYFIYSCPICNENIPNKENANTHLKIHFDGVDEKTFDSKKELKTVDSFAETCGVAGIKCLFCYTICKNRVEFDAHFSCQHGQEDIVYTCIDCGKQFEKYSIFSNHAYNHYTKDRYECDLCSKTFPRLSLLASHMSACQSDTKATGKPFVCGQCGSRFDSAYSLQNHLREVHAILYLECPENGCELKFSKAKELLNHQSCHHKSMKWCVQCGLYFTSLHSCERHLDEHKKKLYICPICNRHYNEKYLILKHVFQHFETVLHLCKVCGKIYNAKNRLVEHMKSHAEAKGHECQYCKKSFTKIAQLQQHLNIHTGSKPYKCPICQKSFTSYPNWGKHIRRMHNVDSKTYKYALENCTTEDDDEEYIAKNNQNETMSVSNESTDNVSLDLVDTGQVSTNKKIDNFTFYELEENTIGSDSIDHAIIEKELEIFENITNIKNDNIVKPGNVLPENRYFLGDGAMGSPSNLSQSTQATSFPLEYGPEFNTGFESSCGSGSGFIDLDDHNLPHIDPLLTIKIDEHNKMYVDTQAYFDTSSIGYNNYGNTPKWEPPIITKVQHDYGYGYGDMADANRLIVLNSDNFEVFT